jgi:preprotein translocase subunit SecF
VPFELVPDGTKIDFLGRRRICLAISALLIVFGVGEVVVNGIPLGIDFVGGTEIQLRFDDGVDVDEAAIRDVTQAEGFRDATVVRFGETDSREYLVRFKAEDDTTDAAPPDEGEIPAVGAPPTEGGAPTASAPPTEDDAPTASVPPTEGDAPTANGQPDEGATPAASAEAGSGDAAGDATGDDADGDGLASNTRIIRLENAIRDRIGPFTEQRVEFVGPRVGEELRADGINALLYSALAILAYVAFRFSARFAPGAVVAVVHDLVVTGGLLVMLDVEFDLRILAAMLAILGYSLNDTIIIYDRIRENLELHTKTDLEEVLNTSVNQTLSRTVLTSLTTLIALLALYFLGGDVIRPFAFAMLIGIVVGTYSSIFVASPLLLFLEERYGGPSEGDRKRGSGKGASGKGGAKRSRSELRV